MLQKYINSFDDLINYLKSVSINQSIFILAIDGRGGGGKSTLAKNIQSVMPCQIVNTDDYFDFENIGSQNYHWNKKGFLNDILFPLKNNMPGNYKKNLWIDGKFTGQKESIQINPSGVIVIEGLMCLQKSLLEFYDETIWIDIDAVEALQRAKDRDIQKGWDKLEVDNNWKKWQQLQEFYITNEDPIKATSIIFKK